MDDQAEEQKHVGEPGDGAGKNDTMSAILESKEGPMGILARH